MTTMRMKGRSCRSGCRSAGFQPAGRWIAGWKPPLPCEPPWPPAVGLKYLFRSVVPRVNLLDRYIFKSVLGTCLGAVMLFTFVLTLGNVIRDLLAHVLAGQLPVMTLVRLVGLWVPAMAIFALPMGLLTGVLLTLGRLSADTRITTI